MSGSVGGSVSGVFDLATELSLAQLAYGSLWLVSLYWFSGTTRMLWRSLGLPKLTPMKATERTITWRSFYLLCFSESFSMVFAMVILWDNKTINGATAVVLANVLNAFGYGKYIYQMFFDAEYVTLSFHIYNTVWLYVAWTESDPVYFLLFRYPWSLLMMIKRYLNMRGRKVLCSDLGLVIHTVDHLLHALISARMMIYHYIGFSAMIPADLLVLSFVVMLSEAMVAVQDPERPKGPAVEQASERDAAVDIAATRAYTDSAVPHGTLEAAARKRRVSVSPRPRSRSWRQ
jgi:hypothetical protein